MSDKLFDEFLGCNSKVYDDGVYEFTACTGFTSESPALYRYENYGKYVSLIRDIDDPPYCTDYWVIAGDIKRKTIITVRFFGLRKYDTINNAIECWHEAIERLESKARAITVTLKEDEVVMRMPVLMPNKDMPNGDQLSVEMMAMATNHFNEENHRYISSENNGPYNTKPDLLCGDYSNVEMIDGNVYLTATLSKKYPTYNEVRSSLEDGKKLYINWVGSYAHCGSSSNIKIIYLHLSESQPFTCMSDMEYTIIREEVDA